MALFLGSLPCLSLLIFYAYNVHKGSKIIKFYHPMCFLINGGLIERYVVIFNQYVI